MSEYVGSETFVTLQKALHARQSEFAKNPFISNGGRIMNVLDPDAYGWDNLRQTAEQDLLLGLTMVDRDTTLDRLSSVFGDTAEFPYWQVFTGTSEAVLPTCAALLSATLLPTGWTLESFSHPSHDIIAEAQKLNLETGIAALPAYYMRGEVMPSMLSCIFDETGAMQVCAVGNMRYHADSELANWMFAGTVSVHPSQRRRGLGAHINAALLRDSQAAFGWTTVLEQAKADNMASVGMIQKCGLAAVPDKVTIVVNLTGGYVSR